MTKTISRGVMSLALLLCAPFAQAQMDAAAAENLMRKTGLWEQIASTAPQMQAGIAAAAKPGSALKPEQLQELSRTASLAFAPERMRAGALRVMGQKVSPANMTSLMAWYDSPTGRQITKLEEAASASGRDPNTLMRDGAALLNTMAVARRNTLTQIVDVTRAPEAATNVVFNIAIATHAGLSNMAARTQGPTTQQLRQELETRRPQLLKAMENLTLAGFALTYATLSDDQLAEYVAFMKTPAGRQITDVSMRAFEQSLADSAKEWGKLLSLARKQRKA